MCVFFLVSFLSKNRDDVMPRWGDGLAGFFFKSIRCLRRAGQMCWCWVARLYAFMHACMPCIQGREYCYPHLADKHRAQGLSYRDNDTMTKRG
jgi:hypothetical protein